MRRRNLGNAMGRYFDDRLDAARQLAHALRRYRDASPLVLAVPRGAVAMAEHIARTLHGEVDVVLARKLCMPGNPEFAVGSVDESGWTYVPEYARDMGLVEAKLARERDAQLELLRWRRALYTPDRGPIDPAGRTCIVVDDGLATGSTMVAALHGIRARRPSRLVCAVPVASEESLGRVRPLADEVVCLSAPPHFRAVGEFYRDFPQVSDDEVAAVLQAHEHVA